MALIAPQFVIEAPQRAPLPHGLFSVAPPVENPGFRWENGVTWKDQACEVLPPVLVDDCASPVGFPKDFTSVLSTGTAEAFTVYGEFLCSPAAFTPDEAQDQAAARLLTREEQAVTARAVTLLTTASGPLEGTDLTGALTTLPSALEVLEDHLATNYGSQGVLLMTLASLYGLGSDATMRVGNTLMTLAGTPIVIERTGAVAAFDMGIIPMPLVFRSEVFPSSNRPGDLLDRGQNDLYAAAERNYVVGWLDCGGAYVNLA